MRIHGTKPCTLGWRFSAAAWWSRKVSLPTVAAVCASSKTNSTRISTGSIKRGFALTFGSVVGLCFTKSVSPHPCLSDCFHQWTAAGASGASGQRARLTARGSAAESARRPNPNTADASATGWRWPQTTARAACARRVGSSHQQNVFTGCILPCLLLLLSASVINVITALITATPRHPSSSFLTSSAAHSTHARVAWRKTPLSPNTLWQTKSKAAPFPSLQIESCFTMPKRRVSSAWRLPPAVCPRHGPNSSRSLCLQ